MVGKTAGCALDVKTKFLKQAISHLSRLPSHNALHLLKNSIPLSKLQWTLKTLPRPESSRPNEFDGVPEYGLFHTLNIDLSDAHGIQA
jgi:hypothetical protein